MRTTSITKTGHSLSSVLTGCLLLMMTTNSVAYKPAPQCEFSPHLSCSDATGNRLWSKPGLINLTPLTLDQNRVYLSQSNRVLSFDRNNGDPAWEINSGSDSLYFFPVLERNNLYLAREDGKLEKRQADTGEIIWSHDIGTGWVYPPAILDHKLVTGGQDGKIWVINAKTGQIDSSTELSQELVTPLLTSGAVFFASTFDGQLGAYRLNQQRKQITRVWQTRMESPVFSFQIQNENLITADMGGKVSSLDSHTGRVNWQKNLHQNALYWNTVHQQTLFSLADSGMLNILDIDSGRLISRLQLSGEYSQAPIVRDDMLVLFDAEGTQQQLLLKALTTHPSSLSLTFNQTRIQ